MGKTCYAVVVIPHPDDAELGIAGTVTKWTSQGKEVIYVVCTNGDKGSNDAEMTPEKLAVIREKEQIEAAKLVEVHEVIFLRHQDQSLEDTPEFRKEIVRLIRLYKPQLVATADPYRRYLWHRDHRITGRVVSDAVYPCAGSRLSYPELLESGLETHKVQEILFWGSEQPNYFVDIADTFEIKMAALRCHVSQIGGFPQEWETRVRKMHEGMAEGTNYRLAEAFYRAEVF